MSDYNFLFSRASAPTIGGARSSSAESSVDSEVYEISRPEDDVDGSDSDAEADSDIGSIFDPDADADGYDTDASDTVIDVFEARAIVSANGTYMTTPWVSSRHIPAPPPPPVQHPVSIWDNVIAQIPPPPPVVQQEPIAQWELETPHIPTTEELFKRTADDPPYPDGTWDTDAGASDGHAGCIAQ